MDLVYCNICSVPPEYCEFGSQLDKCKAWLKSAHNELFEQLYPNEVEKDLSALAEGVSILSLDQNIEKQTKKKVHQPVKDKVQIKREARTKRKSTVSVFGLHFYG